MKRTNEQRRVRNVLDEDVDNSCSKHEEKQTVVRPSPTVSRRSVGTTMAAATDLPGSAAWRGLGGEVATP